MESEEANSMGGKAKAIALVGGGAAVAALLLGTRKSRAATPRRTDVQLSRNFRLSEFLQSSAIPALRDYQPTQDELANLALLVNLVLQPMRDRFGAIRITGGARPPSLRSPEGKTFYDLLLERGYDPAVDSDHNVFGGADVYLTELPAERWPEAHEWAKANPHVRQVISYYKTAAGRVVPDHMHLSVVTPGRPRLVTADFSFAKLDGQRVRSSAPLAEVPRP